ncbi:peptidoglycan bridge formation glycyltransferase FemA/FemB family protein [Candidatus Gottesmanbacteria bacterium]|nr:peptidoglycan bridge formation glycyltransferase FemA/FemB family protein [Candidatus Gottesmanbacteria bacterium]
MEIQQSPLYADFIKLLNWQIVSADGVNIFFKHFPFIGSMAKMHRPPKLPDIKRLVPILKEQKIRSISVEPDSNIEQKKFNPWIKKLAQHITINKTHFLPTKTIHIDLTVSEGEIFARFSEAKRRAVRRALKNNLQIYKSTNINELIRIKNKSTGLFGFVTTTGVDKLWQIFAPKHAAILLAYSNVIASPGSAGRGNPHRIQRLLRRFAPRNDKVFGGVLLLFWNKTAYYWIAGSTKEGKKLFAPTLLVWEALKLSKQRGCKQFDFVGVWDEREPSKFSDWKGFTKFKEGFGGNALSYPILR